MHPLHEYVAKQLSDRLKRRRVVVWYDTKSEFTAFVGELGAGASSLSTVSLGAQAVGFAVFSGSYLAVRDAVEPRFEGDEPDALVVYVPGQEHDAKGSVLLELEKAGDVIGHPHHTLRKWARSVLQQKFTEAVTDEIVGRQRLTYEDVVGVLREGSDGGGAASMLRTLFPALAAEDLVAEWLATAGKDKEVEGKEASTELFKLIEARLGLGIPGNTALGKGRTLTLRYVLGNEFRDDLKCEPPEQLSQVPRAPGKDALANIRSVASRLRSRFPDAYEVLALEVEKQLSLKEAKVQPAKLGSIDTFMFEERSLLAHASALVIQGAFDEALGIVRERQDSFWVNRDIHRKNHWDAVRLMAELGRFAKEVRAALPKANGKPTAWVEGYSADKDGWFRLDMAQRRLETFVSRLDEDPNEQALAVVRRVYDDTCGAMAEGFTQALAKSGWSVAGALMQTSIYPTVVAERPKPVAYFLVDAFRYEMAAELAERLPPSSEHSLRSAIGMLPSITPIGMAALLPGSSSSFSVKEKDGHLGAQIDGAFLKDLKARQKFVAAQVPGMVDLSLDQLLSLKPSDLAKRVEGRPLVIVRSQEIDSAGEGQFTHQARQVMDNVIDNLKRALLKLSAAGVEHAVLSADHGHLFSLERDDSMKVDDPKGDKVELHRRCWIGRGGKTPGGCHRVQSSDLGYDSDLEFIFPPGPSVFKAGGDEAYHHGGPSLQELVLPVLTVRTRRRDSNPPRGSKSSKSPIEVTGVPSQVTNRIQILEVSSLLGGTFRPVLLAKGSVAGVFNGAIGAASFDVEKGVFTLAPGGTAKIGLKLTNDAVETVLIVLLDPTTDAEVFRSADIPVKVI